MPRIRAVTVTAMPLVEKPLLDRLLQLYLHDFSDFAELGTTYAEVDNAGIFPYPPGTRAQSINDVGTALISDVVARLARMRSLLIMMGDDRMSRR